MLIVVLKICVLYDKVDDICGPLPVAMGSTAVIRWVSLKYVCGPQVAGEYVQLCTRFLGTKELKQKIDTLQGSTILRQK